ncbi:Uncharacterised protein [Mycobacteroides abscessus subsp. abscessus]|nr:Uncharacterised protein [Mycobacteroides abscessus subsp. abscessus]
MKGKDVNNGARIMSCSKLSSTASACEEDIHRPNAISCLRFFARARADLRMFFTSGSVTLVCIIGSPISTAASITS